MKKAAEKHVPAHVPAAPAQAWWRHPRSHKVGLITTAVIVVGVAVWAVLFYPYVRTDDARISAALIRVAPEGAGGKIVAVNVQEGSRVKAGDILVELDHGVAEANLRKAKARAGQAGREGSRTEQLAAQHGVAAREVDSARANGSAAEADLALAQIAYDRTFLRSPTDGIVVQKLAELGNLLEAGQSAVVVADIDHAWVNANIQETAVSKVKPGQTVRVEIDEGGELTGKVVDVRAATASQFALIQAENPSGNFTKLVQRIPIKVQLDPHPDRVLRAGQSVEIRIKVHG
jgi:membrane fusion protein (multidrug efflux system)